MTPRPRNATFAIVFLPGTCPAACHCPPDLARSITCGGSVDHSAGDTMVTAKISGKNAMPVTKDDVLASLGKVAGPDGTPLPADRHAVRHRRQRRQGVLLDHASMRASVQAWEPVRKRAEEAVQGDARRAVGDGRADRRAQGRHGRSASAARRAGRRAARAYARPRPAAGPLGRSRRRLDHRGRVRQGRRRQVDHRGQSRARPARSRPEGRHARCRYLRAVDAEAAGDPREAADHRRHAAEADRAATASR